MTLMSMLLFVAFYDPDDQEVKYVHLRAHPVGLSAPVLNFNRVPCFLSCSSSPSGRCGLWLIAIILMILGVFDLVCARGLGVVGLPF